VSAEVRFCSRCGFPLVAVNDLLATGGSLPVHAVSNQSFSPPPISPRRRGVKQGAALLLVGIFLIPFFGILHETIGLPLEFMAISVIVIMAAVLRLIFAIFFEEAAPRTPPQFAAPPQAYTPPIASRLHAPAQESLPPAPPQGVPSYRQPQVDTAQIMHPPSVTDHTTRLLDKQSDQSEQ
jgi:hypothetical protein